jgi:hypothetical protein
MALSIKRVVWFQSPYGDLKVRNLLGKTHSNRFGRVSLQSPYGDLEVRNILVRGV